jgi:hypothetical protein
MEEKEDKVRHIDVFYRKIGSDAMQMFGLMVPFASGLVRC